VRAPWLATHLSSHAEANAWTKSTIPATAAAATMRARRVNSAMRVIATTSAVEILHSAETPVWILKATTQIVGAAVSPAPLRPHVFHKSADVPKGRSHAG